MLTNVSSSIELYVYVHLQRRAQQPTYALSVFAPYSRTDVLLSAMMTSEITEEEFFYGERQDEVFAQARQELSQVMGVLAQHLTFSTVHPNAD